MTKLLVSLTALLLAACTSHTSAVGGSGQAAESNDHRAADHTGSGSMTLPTDSTANQSAH